MFKPWLVALASAVVGSVLSFTLVGQAQPVRQPPAIAYVSVNKLTTDSTYARGEVARLQRLQQERAADLRSRQQAIEATRQQIVEATDGAVRTQLTGKETQQRADLDRANQQMQTDLQNLQRQINNDLQRRVQAAIGELMKTQNYQLVLNSDASVVWAAPGYDMTAAVVGELNAK